MWAQGWYRPVPPCWFPMHTASSNSHAVFGGTCDGWNRPMGSQENSVNQHANNSMVHDSPWFMIHHGSWYLRLVKMVHTEFHHWKWWLMMLGVKDSQERIVLVNDAECLIKRYKKWCWLAMDNDGWRSFMRIVFSFVHSSNESMCEIARMHLKCAALDCFVNSLTVYDVWWWHNEWLA